MAGVGSCRREDLPVKRDFPSFKITLPPPVSFHQSFPLEAEDKDENSVRGIMDLHIRMYLPYFVYKKLCIISRHFLQVLIPSAPTINESSSLS